MSLLLSRRDLDFLLFEWLQVERLLERPRFVDHSRETFDAVLRLSEQIATEHFAPHNKVGDANEPRFDGERVFTTPEAKAALAVFAKADLVGASMDAEVGGQQLPRAVSVACFAWFQAANVATSAYPFLTVGAANLLTAYGSPEQVRTWVPPMVEGRFFGTMCLSETQAGSSLADITTRAEPRDDGSHRLNGSKMWISAGDHDLSENIVHLRPRGSSSATSCPGSVRSSICSRAWTGPPSTCRPAGSDPPMSEVDARGGSARHAGGVSEPCVPLLLAVDGDSMLHRAHHAMLGSEQRDDAGRPTWALRGLVSFIATAAARLTPDAVVVGFDSREDSVRKADFAGYKAQRADKPLELQVQLDDAPGLLAAAGFPVVVATGFEADDVLASAAALARRSGWRATLVTSDRDSFALIDETTSVLRVLNGGMDGSPVLTPAKLPSVCGVLPRQYRDFAALRGDTSDNLPGARGIGSKTAAKLLSVFRTLDDAYAAFDAGRPEELDAAIGRAATARLTAPEARECVLRNQRLMAMRDDLVLPQLAAMKIPLDAGRLRTALAGRGVRLGSSLWALVGEPAPPWSPAGYDRAPQYLPRVEPPQLGTPPVLGTSQERIDLPPPSGPLRRLVVLPRRGLKPVLPGQLSLF